ncbi:MAG: hypothetical protein WC212_00285 [Candidatus Delongbacteria bacterium]|jgi:hypothetical protein|nr:hypothetical protein [Candidatus Delongbacteria bacterium]
MSGKELKTKTIQINVVEVKKLSYYETLLDSFKEKFTIDKKNIPIDFSISFGIDFKNNLFMLELGVVFKNNKKDKVLFGISTYHKFYISDIKSILKEEAGGKSSVNKTFLANLLGIAISGTRGMLAVLNTSDDYKDIYLPIINPMAIIENSKQNLIVVKEEKL